MRRRSVFAVVAAAAVMVVVWWLLARTPADRDVTPNRDLANPSSVRLQRPRAAGEKPDPDRIGAHVRAAFADGTRAVAGATVLARPVPPHAAPGDGVIRATTDESGIAWLPLGTQSSWQFQVLAEGYVGTEIAVDGPALAESASVEFEITPLVRVSGTVFGPDGKSVADATVSTVIAPEVQKRLRLLHPADRNPLRRIQQRTNASGAFDFSALPPSEAIRMVVSAGRIGRSTIELEAIAPGTGRELRIDLEAPTVLVGSVPGPWTEPGATLTVESWHNDGSPYQLLGEQRVPVGVDGRFEIANIAPGDKTLGFVRRRADSIEVGYLWAVAVKSKVTDVGVIPVGQGRLRLLALPEGGAIEARQAFVDLALTDREKPYRVRPLQLTLTVEREFTLVGFPEGRFQAMAWLTAGAPQDRDEAYDTANIDLQYKGDDQLVELVLRQRARDVEGRIQVIADPPPGVAESDLEAHVIVVRDRYVVAAIARGSRGHTHFSPGAFPPGRYEVQIVANGFLAAEAAEVVGGKLTEVRPRVWRQSGRLEGSVVDDSGAPAKSATVFLSTTAESADAIKGPLIELRANDTGKFVLDGLPSLEGLRIHAEGVGCTSPAIAVKSDDRTDGIELRLARRR